MTVPIVLATRNSGKLVELRSIFAEAGMVVSDLADAGLPVAAPEEAELEAFNSFTANALAKARHFSRVLQRACVADDSGLEVFALGGQPGVRSRRWASDNGIVAGGEEAANNDYLFQALTAVSDRRARFVCAAAYCDPARELVAIGSLEGSITDRPRGEHGFGYDPFFFAGALGKTLAEATVVEKQRVSHRAAAFRALVEEIAAGN